MSEILNDITTHYQLAANGWYTSLFPIANHLFTTLAIIEIAWSGIWWAIDKQDLSSLWQEFLKRIVFIGFFYALLLHAQSWIPGLIKSFMLVGAQASHIDKLDPSTIFSQGLSIASSVLIPLEKKNLLSALLPYLIGGSTVLIVGLSFALIAGELVVTLIESYLVVGAGILFLGLGSSRWTNALTTAFLSYAIRVGSKLFFLYLIIGVGINLSLHWGLMLEQAGTDSMTPFLEVMGGALVFVYITCAIPNKAAALFSGAFHANFAGMMANTAFIYQQARQATHTVMKIKK